jgi:alpha galactosidase A-like protein/alpha galactosidase C-like protein/alpha-galactosidase-like protein
MAAMKRLTRAALAAALVTVPTVALAGPAGAQDNGVGLTPLMGWSSWSFVRHNPTAATIEAQADAMRGSGLAAVGYRYVNVDDFWYVCPGSQGPDVDDSGRWVIDTAKFPDGIAAVADHVHADGLKFGLYVTPGISKQAVARNTAIEGTPYHAADIATATAEKNYNCKGMVGIDYTKPGAQEFVNSWADEFASWGVDYVKIDGVGTSDIPDIQAWSAALRQTGRPIHLELSNNLSVSAATTWRQYANGWRTGGDIECYGCESGGSSYPLTDWAHVRSRFNQVATWQPYGGPGGFNDYDSIEVGNGTNDGLTVDERKTQLSLWALAASPFILGTDLTALDPADLRLLTNREVIAVDQDSIDASRIVNLPTAQVFAKTEADGEVVVGLFNLADSTQVVSTTAAAVGLPAAQGYLLNDLWSHIPAETAGVIAADVAPHGVVLYRIHPTVLARLAPPSTTVAVTGLSTVDSGVPVTATESFTDNGLAPVQHVRLALSAPAGWMVSPTTPTDFPVVGSGQTVQASFQVTAPPPAALFQSDTLGARAEYRWLGFFPLSVSASQVVTTSAPVLAPNRTFASTTASFAQAGTRLGIRAAGSDVYGATNQYGAIYQPGALHDGTVAVVEVTAQANTNAWAKAGIMVRNDITGAAASPGFLILAEAPGHGYVVQWDANGDGQLDSNSAPANTGLGTATYPSWLKLVRSGTSYTGYYSTDGTTWTTIATVSVPSAADTQDVGVFATSHSSGTVGEVDFDGFTLS